MHLKCHVCEHGATKRHWQGCRVVFRQQPKTQDQEAAAPKLTAIEFKQMEQS